MGLQKSNEYILVRHSNRHVRKIPNKCGESIHITEDGQRIPYLGKVQNGWYKVKIGGRIGWLYHTAGDIHNNYKEKLNLKEGNWHVRAEARHSAKSLITINEMTEVFSLNEEENNWHKVEAKGIEGWISVRSII